VDSALHWFHTTLRKGCGGLTFHKVVAHNLGVTPSEAIAQDSQDRLMRALEQIEECWLRDGASGAAQRFIGGRDPNVADLLFACELEQLHMLHSPTDGTDFADLLRKFPRTRQWMRDVSAALHPHYEAVHKLLRYAAGKRHQKLAAQNHPHAKAKL